MNAIRFLGTAGARFVVMKQLRASGGLWLSLDGTNLLIDPGPGSLLQCLGSQPPLDPRQLDGIILTHRHLDHVNDVNIMVEAMTNGGYARKGTLLAPGDALVEDPVVFKHVRMQVSKLVTLKESSTYPVGTLTVATTPPLHHGVETYGLNIQGNGITVSLVTDTAFFPQLPSVVPGDVLIINVVLSEAKPQIQHLCLADAERIIREAQPKLAVLTHFGMTLVRADPGRIASELSERLGTNVLAATDGLCIDLDPFRSRQS